MGWHKLDSALLFDMVWQPGDLHTFTAMLVTQRKLHASLVASLNKQQSLVLHRQDVSLRLAEVVAKLVGLKSLRIAGRDFCVDDLRSQRLLDLSQLGHLTIEEAIMLAPVLRTNRELTRIKCTFAWLLVDQVRDICERGGTEVMWSSIQPRQLGVLPGPSAPDYVVFAGLLEKAPSESREGLRCMQRRREQRPMRLQTERDPAQWCYGQSSLMWKAFSAAELRIGRRIVWSHPSIPTAENCGCLSSALHRLVLLLMCFSPMLLLRGCEHSYAIEHGYGGALMPHHPLRKFDFAERARMGLYIAAPDARFSDASESCVASLGQAAQRTLWM